MKGAVDAELGRTILNKEFTKVDDAVAHLSRVDAFNQGQATTVKGSRQAVRQVAEEEPPEKRKKGSVGGASEGQPNFWPQMQKFFEEQNRQLRQTIQQSLRSQTSTSSSGTYRQNEDRRDGIHQGYYRKRYGRDYNGQQRMTDRNTGATGGGATGDGTRPRSASADEPCNQQEGGNRQAQKKTGATGQDNRGQSNRRELSSGPGAQLQR